MSSDSLFRKGLLCVLSLLLSALTASAFEAGKVYTLTTADGLYLSSTPSSGSGATASLSDVLDGRCLWQMQEAEGKGHYFLYSPARKVFACGPEAYHTGEKSTITGDTLRLSDTWKLNIGFSEKTRGWVLTPENASRAVKSLGVADGVPSWYTATVYWTITDISDRYEELKDSVFVPEPQPEERINSLGLDELKSYYIAFNKGGAVLQDGGAGQLLSTAAASTSERQQWQILEQGTGKEVFWYIVNKATGLYIGYDTSKAYFVSRKEAEIDKLCRLNIFKSSTSGCMEIGVKDYETGKAMNQWGGTGAGRNLGLWDRGNVNNPLRFRLYDELDLPLEECTSISPLSGTVYPDEKLTLWYNKPGTNWMNEALPIGNGQFGGTFYGGVRQEEVQFNDKTLWTGTSGDPIGAGSGYGCYRNFGNLFITALGVEPSTKVTGYRRLLDIHNAVGRVCYTIDGIDYQREYIVSYPAEVMVIHLTASEKGHINVDLRVSDGNQESYPAQASGAQYTEEGITFKGKLDLLNYYFRLGIETTGSQAATAVVNGKLRVTGADELTIVMRGNTNFSEYDNSYIYPAAELPGKVDAVVEKALSRNWEKLRQEHIDDYRSLFDRCSFTISGPDTNSRPTDRLIQAYNNSYRSFPFLEELYFNYGRYLMISSARGIGLPSNLQGIWNHSNSPAWNSDIHSNINVQMNYWPAEVTNLSELHMTFIDYVYNESVGRSLHDGKDTQWQKNVYNYLTTSGKDSGNRQKRGGWFLTTENNIFGRCSRWTGQNYAVANAWYCMHLWQHYQYTLDREYLRDKALPVMLSAVTFWKNRLVKDKNDNTWICPYEFSPEHGPAGATTAHAQQLVYTLFENTLAACDVLGDECGVSDNDRATLQSYLDHLDNGLHTEQVARANNQILLREWKDYSQQDTGEWPHHRHLSHLIGLYPGTQINPTANDSIYQAALRSLSWRGLAATGWAMGWKVNLWARAQDAANARTLLRNALNSCHTSSTDMSGSGAGVYDNLFDAHPPYQIDGNFGVCAGIAEMLMQSHAGYIHLLPALPVDWKEGSMHGLKAQGNFTVSVDWSAGTLSQAEITSVCGGVCRVLAKDIAASPEEWMVVSSKGRNVDVERDDDGVISFSTQPGQTFLLCKGEADALAWVKAAATRSEAYDLSGRRLRHHQRGITIKDGKKMFSKN